MPVKIFASIGGAVSHLSYHRLRRSSRGRFAGTLSIQRNTRPARNRFRFRPREVGLALSCRFGGFLFTQFFPLEQPKGAEIVNCALPSDQMTGSGAGGRVPTAWQFLCPGWEKDNDVRGRGPNRKFRLECMGKGERSTRTPAPAG